MLKCSCGFDLFALRGVKVEDESILNLTELICWKLNNHDYDETNLIKEGYPLNHLSELSLSSLLGIIERLGEGRLRKTIFPQFKDLRPKFYALKRASNLFANWPNGFYDYLKNLSPENRHIESRNLQSQYTHFYNSIFRSNLPEAEVMFLKQAFVTFANDRLAEDVYVDIRISNQASTPRRYVGIIGLAKHLKVQLPTIRNYEKKALITSQLRKGLGKPRKVFDLHNLPFKAKEGNYFKKGGSKFPKFKR